MCNLLRHEIVDNVYKLYEGDVCKLTIKLDDEFKAVTLLTDKEIFSGPIDLICLTADIEAEAKNRLSKES